MKRFMRRLRIELEDTLRYHPFVRERVADYYRYRGWKAPPDAQGRIRAIKDLCAAARIGLNLERIERTSRRIHEHLIGLDYRSVDWSEFVSGLSPILGMSELIKAPHGQEKGVLFVPFEVEWARLMVNVDLVALAQRYHVVLAPSSSPYNLINYIFSAVFPGPLFTTISNPENVTALPSISSRFVVVPLYASSWVDPTRFLLRSRHERDLDLVMVANWGKPKRHHALLRALRNMPRSLRVHLIGQDSDGRNADTIRSMASAYGVADRFTLQSDAAYPQVADTLCRARASVIVSRREGSCVVVAESLFADTPVALLRGAEIGSRVFLNEQTGRFLDERNLGRELMAFIDEAECYRPRAWADANISCYRSVDILNGLLARHAAATGETWTAGVRAFTWCPFPRVIDPVERAALAPARRELHERFGITISEDGV